MRGRGSDDDELDPDDTNPDGRGSRALVVQKRSSILVAESMVPMAQRLPQGMADTRQLDNFRELRTRLLAMAEGVGIERFTTLVVPLAPGSGASFVARNLAAAFTLEDRLAVLVDCNLRHPTQHLALSARAEDGGLFDYLDSPNDHLERLLRPTGISGLHLIPAGRPSNPHREYFSSQAMRQVIASLREEPCYLFLDGPATMGAPDARILSQLADFVVLVVGYGRNTPEDIAQAASLFDPNKFAGVVFNERADT